VVDSTDIYQSVFMEFFAALKRQQLQVESDSQMLRVLATMARNNVVKQTEKQQALRRDMRRTASAPAEEMSLTSHDPDPADIVVRRLLIQSIQSRLTEEELSLIRRRVDGQSWQEIADELGSTADAVRMRVVRIGARIKRELNLDDQDVA
jgi:RNA polymerase sigma factor (sigma-70 family)